MLYKLKKTLKSSIEKLPLGSEVILPCVKFFYNPLNIRSKYLKKRTEIKEAKEILKACQSDQIKEVVIIYDLLSSASTYGDFFYVVMLARYFLLFDKKMHFWIINSEFRHDAMESYTAIERQEYVCNILELPRTLLNCENRVDIRTYTWDEAVPLLSLYENQGSVFTCFKQMVTNRDPFYQYCFNVINHLFEFDPDIDREKYFLSIENFNSLDVELPGYPYITWAARYSKPWAYERNLTVDEFAPIYESLKSYFPKHKIMVVSDEIGCAHFKEVSMKNDLDLIFSKDFSKSFMGDAALIINSDYFFVLRSGGISAIPVFSKMPYGIIATPIHETIKYHRKMASWSTKEQIFISSGKGMPEDVLLSQTYNRQSIRSYSK
jgi:hypothetical protein